MLKKLVIVEAEMGRQVGTRRIERQRHIGRDMEMEVKQA